MNTSTAFTRVQAPVTDHAAPPLEEAVHVYGKEILRYCYSILGDYYEAQDARQETFVKAYIATFGGGNYRAWLYKIAYNTCLNILRKKRFPLLFGTYDAKHAAEPSHTPDMSIAPDVRRALAILPPRDRALVYNRAVEDMDYAQLSELYGTSESALRKRYERAKKKLHRHLTRAGYPI